MKILLKSEEGINLESFLKKNKDILELTELRVFYIVSANLDKRLVYKIGIAGFSEGKSYPRLDSYLHQYGKNDKSNSCRGVKVHYIGTVAYNKNVYANKSQVHVLELRLKQQLKEKLKIVPGRGSERVSSTKMPLKKLFEEIDKILPTINETEFVITKKTRVSTRTVDKVLDKYRKQTGAFKDSVNAPITQTTPASCSGSASSEAVQIPSTRTTRRETVARQQTTRQQVEQNHPRRRSTNVTGEAAFPMGGPRVRRNLFQLPSPIPNSAEQGTKWGEQDALAFALVY